MKMDVHYSSNTIEWETPQYLYDEYNKLYNFDLDVCASNENKKCINFFTKNDDALSKEWLGNCWMNPPYGRNINLWIKKAYEESLKKATVVCLIPSRTDTRWWHEYVMKGNVIFLKGRLKFGNAKYNAPFPNAILIFNNVINNM